MEFTFLCGDKSEHAIPLIELRQVHLWNFRPQYSVGVSEVRSRRGNWNLSGGGGRRTVVDPEEACKGVRRRRNPTMATQSRRLWPTSYRSFLLLRLYHLPSSFPLETIILIPYILFKRPALSQRPSSRLNVDLTVTRAWQFDFSSFLRRSLIKIWAKERLIKQSICIDKLTIIIMIL